MINMEQDNKMQHSENKIEFDIFKGKFSLTGRKPWEGFLFLLLLLIFYIAVILLLKAFVLPLLLGQKTSHLLSAIVAKFFKSGIP
jgi:hypothetical protein